MLGDVASRSASSKVAPFVRRKAIKSREDEGLKEAHAREGQRLLQHYKCAGSAQRNYCRILRQ